MDRREQNKVHKYCQNEEDFGSQVDENVAVICKHLQQDDQERHVLADVHHANPALVSEKVGSQNRSVP